MTLDPKIVLYGNPKLATRDIEAARVLLYQQISQDIKFGRPVSKVRYTLPDGTVVVATHEFGQSYIEITAPYVSVVGVSSKSPVYTISQFGIWELRHGYIGQKTPATLPLYPPGLTYADNGWFVTGGQPDISNSAGTNPNYQINQTPTELGISYPTGTYFSIADNLLFISQNHISNNPIVTPNCPFGYIAVFYGSSPVYIGKNTILCMVIPSTPTSVANPYIYNYALFEGQSVTINQIAPLFATYTFDPTNPANGSWAAASPISQYLPDIILEQTLECVNLPTPGCLASNGSITTDSVANGTLRCTSLSLQYPTVTSNPYWYCGPICNWTVIQAVSMPSGCTTSNPSGTGTNYYNWLAYYSGLYAMQWGGNVLSYFGGAQIPNAYAIEFNYLGQNQCGFTNWNIPQRLIGVVGIDSNQTTNTTPTANEFCVVQQDPVSPGAVDNTTFVNLAGVPPNYMSYPGGYALIQYVSGSTYESVLPFPDNNSYYVYSYLDPTSTAWNSAQPPSPSFFSNNAFLYAPLLYPNNSNIPTTGYPTSPNWPSSSAATGTVPSNWSSSYNGFAVTFPLNNPYTFYSSGITRLGFNALQEEAANNWDSTNLTNNPSTDPYAGAQNGATIDLNTLTLIPNSLAVADASSSGLGTLFTWMGTAARTQSLMRSTDGGLSWVPVGPVSVFPKFGHPAPPNNGGDGYSGNISAIDTYAGVGYVGSQCLLAWAYSDYSQNANGSEDPTSIAEVVETNSVPQTITAYWSTDLGATWNIYSFAVDINNYPGNAPPYPTVVMLGVGKAALIWPGSSTPGAVYFDQKTAGELITLSNTDIVLVNDLLRAMGTPGPGPSSNINLYPAWYYPTSSFYTPAYISGSPLNNPGFATWYYTGEKFGTLCYTRALNTTFTYQLCQLSVQVTATGCTFNLTPFPVTPVAPSLASTGGVVPPYAYAISQGFGPPLAGLIPPAYTFQAGVYVEP